MSPLQGPRRWIRFWHFRDIMSPVSRFMFRGTFYTQGDTHPRHLRFFKGIKIGGHYG